MHEHLKLLGRAESDRFVLSSFSKRRHGHASGVDANIHGEGRTDGGGEVGLGVEHGQREPLHYKAMGHAAAAAALLADVPRQLPQTLADLALDEHLAPEGQHSAEDEGPLLLGILLPTGQTLA